jgi:Flp pilus assembly protein TadD
MNKQANFQTAVQLLESGRFDEALRMGKALLRSEKKSEPLLQFCGTCAINLGELKEAKKHYSSLVKHFPKNPRYWSDLAYIYYSDGDLKRGRHAYSQAARLEPRNPDHILGDAICRVADGDLDGGAEHYSTALKLAPDHPRALHGLANVRRQQSRPLEAMTYLYPLSEIIAASDPAFWVEFAEVAFSITDIPETLRALENAQSIGGYDSDVEARIALLYSKMGRAKEAIATIKQAMDRAPEDTEILNDAASIFVEASDNNAASALYGKILTLRPDLAKIHFSLSQLRKFSPQTAEDVSYIAEMENALKGEVTDPALLHFALGKAFTDMGEVDKAFHHLVIGNDLRKKQRPYSLQPDRDRVQRLQQRFPVGSISPTSAPVPKDTLSPIFILGMPRSGTTLVEQIIGAHPEVTPCGELILLNNILSTKFPNDEAELSPQDWKETGDLYREKISGLAAGKNRITDKLPHNFFNVGAIWSALPDARVILLQRDPVDIGLSCYQVCFSAGLDFTHDLTMIGEFYQLFEQLCDHWKKIAPDRLLTVQYEDLVRDTDPNIRRILEFCNLEWHADCERYFEKNRRIATASFNQANKPIYLSSVEKWRQFERHLHPLIEALGQNNR